MANKSGIHIKPENKGKFTASAKKAGRTVRQQAKAVMSNPKASSTQRKRANFACLAQHHWKAGACKSAPKAKPAAKKKASTKRKR